MTTPQDERVTEEINLDELDQEVNESLEDFINRSDTEAEQATVEAIESEHPEPEEAPADAEPDKGSEAGEPEPEPGPAVADASGEDARIREEYQKLLDEKKQREQEEQQRQFEKQVNDRAEQYAQQLEQQGWYPEQAREYARAKAQNYILQNQMEQQAKQTYALNLAQQYGVQVDEIIGYSTPDAMELAAKNLAGRSKEINELKAELERVKKAQKASIPPQNYDRAGGVRGRSSAEQEVDRYNNGDIDSSQLSENAKRLIGIIS